MKKILIPILALSTMACNNQENKEYVSGVHYEYIDTTVKAQEHFTKFASGKWLDYNPKNPQYRVWGSFSIVTEQNNEKIYSLVKKMSENNFEENSNEFKIGTFYNLCMDSIQRNNQKAEPLKKILKYVDACQTKEDFFKLLGKWDRSLYFRCGIDIDSKNSNRYIISISQGGLMLNNPDYYTGKTADSPKVIDALKKYLTRLQVLCDIDENEAKKITEKELEIQTIIAKESKTLVELRDPEANYNLIKVEDLQKEISNFNWREFLDNLQYKETFEVNLEQEKPVRKATELLTNLPLETLKNSIKLRLMMEYAQYLSEEFLTARHEYQIERLGNFERKESWKEALDNIDSHLGEMLGQIYVKNYFPEEAKNKMLELIGDLKVAFEKRIEKNTWMSDSTKAIAIDKLKSMGVKVGYPNKWTDYSNLKVDRTISLAENIFAFKDFFKQLEMEKYYNKPVDKEDWFMNPQTVNAYYSPVGNEICFPAAILQAPFFDQNADASVNYGAIGAVIGHEMTHGFDDQGRQFDKTGNLTQWWAEEDIQKFKVPAEKIKDFYSNIVVLENEKDTLRIKGDNCLGENIADIGGLNIAFDALKLNLMRKPLPNEFDKYTNKSYSAEQRFFLAFVNLWAGEYQTDETIYYYVENDVHSPFKQRALQTPRFIDEFYTLFDIKEGDNMFIKPEERIYIW